MGRGRIVSVAQKPAARNITVADMNGRIAEIEHQRNQALTRCSILAGEKAEAIDLLRTHIAEIERLNAVINAANPLAEPPAAAPTEPAGPLQ